MNRLALALGALLLAAPAYAQVQPSSVLNKPLVKPDADPTKRPVYRAPPSAVPGSRAEQDGAAPAQGLATDMPPNEALFDAINRGDLSGAKDALGRGADIHAHNVLGLTPTELAVDLGRNDISFLLLSLRGESGYNPTRGTVAGAVPSATDRRAAQREEAAARRQQLAADRRQQAASRVAATPAPRNARLFAGDGGAPVPQAGFLGFDATR